MLFQDLGSRDYLTLHWKNVYSALVSAHPRQLFSLHICAACMQITIVGYFDAVDHNRKNCNVTLWLCNMEAQEEPAHILLCLEGWMQCPVHWNLLLLVCLLPQPKSNVHSRLYAIKSQSLLEESRWCESWAEGFKWQRGRAFTLVLGVCWIWAPLLTSCGVLGRSVHLHGPHLSNFQNGSWGLKEVRNVVLTWCLAIINAYSVSGLFT